MTLPLLLCPGEIYQQGLVRAAGIGGIHAKPGTHTAQVLCALPLPIVAAAIRSNICRRVCAAVH